MKTSTTIHDVIRVRIKAAEVMASGQYRNIEIETADGHVFEVVAFSNGDPAIEVDKGMNHE